MIINSLDGYGLVAVQNAERVSDVGRQATRKQSYS
jgi:hypothetical protein